jgi:hypothetical protein
VGGSGAYLGVCVFQRQEQRKKIFWLLNNRDCFYRLLAQGCIIIGKTLGERSLQTDGIKARGALDRGQAHRGAIGVQRRL